MAQECNTCRETIIAFESGKTPPNRTFREILARVLSNPILEYFPPYSVGQFSKRLEIRFQHEKDAAKYFLEGLQLQDIESFKEVYLLYQRAFEQQIFLLLIILDEYVHMRLMSAHPDRAIKVLMERYAQDYIDFFKVWVHTLNFDITVGHVTTHSDM